MRSDEKRETGWVWHWSVLLRWVFVENASLPSSMHLCCWDEHYERRQHRKSLTHDDVMSRKASAGKAQHQTATVTSETCDEPTEMSSGRNERLRVCRGLGKRSAPLELTFTSNTWANIYGPCIFNWFVLVSLGLFTVGIFGSFSTHFPIIFHFIFIPFFLRVKLRMN